MKKTIQKIPKVLPVLFLLVFMSVAALAQNVITGTVTDSKTGAPVAGVTVTVKGTKTSTQTGSDGTFKLNAPAGKNDLIFSSVGYAPQDMTATAGSASVSLVQTNQQLSEVVVVGYGTLRKKDVTGAVSTVTAKDFQKGAITTPEQLIAGKVPGVSITSNGGRPGEGSTIRIRGGSSLNASNDPLIVIDGVPLDHEGIAGASNALSFINPNDIESFTILKDASAAAIYGTRAANGVILITTKKGRTGALKATYSNVESWSQISDKVDVLTADQVRALVNEKGSPQQKAWLGSANTDWQDVIYHTGVSTDNNVTLSGGIKKLPYRLSAGYGYYNGILVTDHMEKISLGFNLNPSFFQNHLKVDLNIKGVRESARFADAAAIGSAVSFDPTQKIYSGNSAFGGYYEHLQSNGKLLEIGRAPNPLGRLELTSDLQTPKRSFGNLQLDYKFHFLPDLHANLNLGYDVSKNTGFKFVPATSAVAYNVPDPTKGGTSNHGKQIKQNTVLDFYLNYVKDLTKIRSRIDVTAGYSFNNYNKKDYNSLTLSAVGDSLNQVKPTYVYHREENALIGIFGRLNFVYHDKYMLTATIRRDGSSRFNEDNRWGTFPSAALGWKIKDDLFRGSRVISDLKLRIGYGVTGQQDGDASIIGNYDYYSYYGGTALQSSYIFGDSAFFAQYPFAFNPNKKWETTTNYNLALDYGLLNNRINGSVDFYYKKTKDLLLKAVQPAGSNFSSYVIANVGDMDNRGVELNLNLQAIRTRNTTLDINFNATYNKNEITNLTAKRKDPNYIGLPVGSADAVNGFIQINAVGDPKNTFYLFHQIYDKDGKPIEGAFEDLNRDGVINEKDKYKGHAADPTVYYGFSVNATYKKWNFGFSGRANFNNYVYNNINSNFGRENGVAGDYHLGNASVDVLNTKFAGDNDQQTLSDYYVENASFLKLDNINIGYNIGKIGKSRLFNLRIMAVCQNVFTITKYSGLDPEHGDGIDKNLYPRPRTISAGFNLDF